MTSTDPVRIGLLSTANITRHLLATRTGADPYTFVALGSRDLRRGEEVAREWDIPRALGSYEALLADPGVEAVYVALPNTLHHRWTMQALAAGKHVLCEKPFSRHPPEVEEAFAAARAAGLVLMEAYMWRHNPQTKLLVRLLPEVGELLTVRSTFWYDMRDREHNVRLMADAGGGSVLDVGCYCVSASRLLLGRDPDRAYGEAVSGPTGVDESFTGVLRFGGVLAEFTCGFATTHESIEVVGRGGSIVVPDPWFGRQGLVLVNGREERVEPVSSYRCELENFAAAVRGEAEPLLGLEDALGQSRTLDALLRSSEQGAPTAP